MKKTIAFFDLAISGHHLEYLYHISQNKNLIKNTNVIFIVNHGFTKVYEEMFGVSVNQEINIIEIAEKESFQLKGKNKARIYYKKFSLFKKYVINNNIQSCFLMDIYPLLWFLCFFRFKVTFSGIYFIPILVSEQSYHSKVKMFILRKSINKNIWRKIYVLNNPDIADKLNKQYKKNGLFESLVDPVLNIKTLNLTKEKPIHTFSERICFLHIGSISVRKGTFEILNAIELLSEDVLRKIECIIAGMVTPELAVQIQNQVEKINISKNLKAIYFYNKKLSYFEFDYLFSGCDYVLVPYLIPNMSSGIILHALNYNKPLIGPSDGLMGQLIRQNGAGICISPTSIDIANAITEASNVRFLINQERRMEFLDLNSSEKFVQKITNTIF